MSKIEREARAELTVKRSRFYAVVLPLQDQVALDRWLATRRRELKKACHHCWAARWRQSDGRLVELAQNDGEVGRPGLRLLALLQQHDLEGALVVSRIFGGVKLGPGGVGRAFRQAAVAALDASGPKSRGEHASPGRSSKR